MKKSDLKDGMIVKIEGYSNEEYDGLMLVLGEFFFDINGYEKKTNFDENMINIDLKKVKITEVYEVIEPFSLKEILNEGKGLRLIWKRPREIDWSKVPFGTKVQASDHSDLKGSRHNSLVSYEKRLKKPFLIFNEELNEVFSYKYCRIHPSVKIQEEWYKE
ncbi:hypothetical protein [Clostridium perfringens]|uniref:hypothetical protein n=1 Tax=Clostridium perfringens TaxID=1502 RepID=UPI00096A2CB3|nr:hypothetical protein [Clostridium perfringens]